MNSYRIAVVVGSLRRDSHNRRLATALATLAPAAFSFEQVRIDDLPLYNLFDEAGNIGNADTRKFLQRWVDRYVAWVVSHAT